MVATAETFGGAVRSGAAEFCAKFEREREVDELDDLLRLLGAACSNAQGCARIESGVGVSSASPATPFEVEVSRALSQLFALRLNGRCAFTRPW